MGEYTKLCPICSKQMAYKRKEDLTFSIKKGARCRSCANSGENHPCYGRKASTEELLKKSIRMSGKNNPNYGRITPDEVRYKISRGNKGHKPTNIEVRKGKTLEEIYGEERAKEIKEKYKQRPPHTVESNRKRSESCKKAGCGMANIGRVPSDETRRKQRLKYIEKLKATNCNFHPPYNVNACKYFDLLMEKTGSHIRHALNGGELFLSKLGYWLDGYDELNNIAYEFDELKHHYVNGELTEKDKKRQKEIEDFLQCRFIRIKETEVNI